MVFLHRIAESVSPPNVYIIDNHRCSKIIFINVEINKQLKCLLILHTFCPTSCTLNDPIGTSRLTVVRLVADVTTLHGDWTRLLSFVSPVLLSTFILLFLPSSSVSLSNFYLAVPMRWCLGKHSCMSSPFPIAMLNGTCSLRALILLCGDAPAVKAKLNKQTMIQSESFIRHCSAIRYYNVTMRSWVQFCKEKLLLSCVPLCTGD